MDNTTRVDNPINKATEILFGAPDAEKHDKDTIEAVSGLLDGDKDESLPQVDENSLDNEPVALETDVADEDTALAAADDAADEDVVDSLNNLADELDIPIADMYELHVNLSEGEQMTLGAMKDFYESNKGFEAEREAFKTKEAELQTEAEMAKEVPHVSNELIQARAQVMSIQDQYNRTDWDTLRAQSPGEYAALQADFNNNFQIAKDNERIATESVATHQTQARQLQVDRLFEAMPELKEDSVRQEAQKSVIELTSKYGFTQTDVDNIEDHRLLRLLIDASKVTSASETAKTKKIVDVPKANNPNGARPLPSSRKVALKKLTEKARASGQTVDQVAAVSALLS